MNKIDLSGKVAIVTGSGRGLGLAFAKAGIAAFARTWRWNARVRTSRLMPSFPLP